MKTLIEKEIRLLLPAFAGALALAIVPAWVLPYNRWNPENYSVLFFWFGIALLSLSSFGREIGLKTLSFMLAQPLNRMRVWWTKIAVLGFLVVLVFDAWWLSEKLLILVHPSMPNLTFGAMVFAVVLFATGLWTTLLLRQVTAAFWLTILIPTVIFMAIRAVGGTEKIAWAVLAIYATAGFFVAHRRFLCLQDTAWTGGVVTLGGRRTAEGSAVRARRPFAALFWKELQLHEFTIAGIVVLLALHIGVILLRKVGANVFGHSTLSALEMFGVVWLFVPLLAGSQSVADERQLGTLGELLCLPVSRRAQFVIKFLFVIVLGGLFSAALLCGVEAIGTHINAGAHLGIMKFNPGNVSGMFWIFLTLCLIGFYASTLTQSVVQSLAAGVVATLLYWAMYSYMPFAQSLFGIRLWPVIAYPTLTVTVLWLAYGNFRSLFESGRRWRRNIFALVVVNVLICCLATAIYHRVWEVAMPLEEAHGPARLPKGKPIPIRGNGRSAFGIVLPDGRLWTDRILYVRDPVSTVSFSAPGSNWLDVAPLERETVALRTDGTLWLSDSNASPFAQFGSETNWQSLASRGSAAVTLLKRDGSLWYWGTNNVNWKIFPGLRAVTPRRLGSDSDWARILRGAHSVFAWKRNGEAWALHFPDPDENWGNVRLPGLDHVQFRSLIFHPFFGEIEIGVRDDGTLCYWNWWKNSKWARYGERLGTNDLALPDLVQIGQGSQWIAVSSQSYQVVALKSDGSLWQWNLFSGNILKLVGLRNPPERLGINQDWLGLGMWHFDTAALSADGSIWAWPSGLPRAWRADSDRWLLRSRRPAKIANILDTPGFTPQ